MAEPVVEAQVRAVFPTSGGCAVFVGNDEKNFVIYIDPATGNAISQALRKAPRMRPQTHDLIGDIFLAVGAEVKRVVINHYDDGVFYARLIFEIENEVQERKIVELDARPSDAMALAVAAGAPILVARPVWDGAEDMTDLLEKMELRGFEIGENED